MGRRKRKLTAAEKAEKQRRKAEYMTIFVRGKQKRVKRDLPLMVDGVPVEDFIRANADPIWLHQNEMWEELHELYEESSDRDAPERERAAESRKDGQLRE